MAAFVLLGIMLGAATASAAALRDDGIHFEPWIKISFLDFKEDLQEALDKGKKGLVVLFEQPGCGSCKKLHEINFADEKLVKFITDHFDVLQINLYGDNEVTGFDGKVLSEAKFSEQSKVNFTPTTVFYGKNGTEVFRMPGFFSKNFYKNGFEYVIDDGPGKGMSYPRWTREKRAQTAKEKTGS